MAKKRSNYAVPATGPDALLNKLQQLYGGRAAERDALGRRAALPSEIARAIGRSGANSRHPGSSGR